MNEEQVIFITIAGIFFAVAAIGAALPPESGTFSLKQARRSVQFFTLISAILLVYVIWERQGKLQDACDSLRVAMDFEGNGTSIPGQLSFDQSVTLFERIPALREATRVCRAAS
jgi:hypothetical protein